MYTKAFPVGLTIFIYKRWLISSSVNCPSLTPINFNWHSAIEMESAHTLAPLLMSAQADSFKCNYFNRSPNKPSNFSEHFFASIIPRGKHEWIDGFFCYFFQSFFIWLRISSVRSESLMDCSVDIFVTHNKNNINNNYRTVAKFNSILLNDFMFAKHKRNGFYCHEFGINPFTSILRCFFYQTKFFNFLFFQLKSVNSENIRPFFCVGISKHKTVDR